MAVKDLVVDQDIDILALTETWLRPGNIDDVAIRALCPTGYRFLHVPRGHSRGGGVGLLFKDTRQINSHITDTFTTMNSWIFTLEVFNPLEFSLFIALLITPHVRYFLKNSQCFGKKLWLNPLVTY